MSATVHQMEKAHRGKGGNQGKARRHQVSDRGEVSQVFVDLSCIVYQEVKLDRKKIKTEWRDLYQQVTGLEKQLLFPETRGVLMNLENLDRWLALMLKVIRKKGKRGVA